MSREEDQCQLFVLYEEQGDGKRSVIWEDCHCGPGTGLTRMMRRNRKRRMQEKFPSKNYSTYQYDYQKGRELVFDESSNTFIQKAEK
jgi:hypothetical protein